MLCSHNGDPPREELAKFGYRLDKSKVDKLFKILLYFGNLLSRSLQFQEKKKNPRNLGTYPSTMASSTHVCQIIN